MSKLVAASNDDDNGTIEVATTPTTCFVHDKCRSENASVVVCTTDDLHSEKCDILPEHSEKSSCDVTPVDDESTSVSAMSSAMSLRTTANETTTTTTPSDVSGSATVADDKTCDSDAKSKSAVSGMAFTIDFNEGKTVDNRKYKEIVERFQNRQQQQRRHRRGVSLSKLDDTRKSSSSLNNGGRCSPLGDDPTPVATKPPMKMQRPRIDVEPSPVATVHRVTDEKYSAEQVPPVTKVTLRRRPLQAQQLQQFEAAKDSSKRHSWSPRSSLNYDAVPQVTRNPLANEQPKRTEKPTMFQPKSATLQRALEFTTPRQTNTPSPKPTAKSAKSFESHVTVVTEPLEYVRQSDESVSDAGTYTLDGDNYTEEEKERMSIDKLARKNQMASAATAKTKVTTAAAPMNCNRKYMNLRTQPQAEISVGSAAMRSVGHKKRASSVGAKNVLEVNYEQSGGTSKTAKVSYLDKIKSRVKTIGDRTFHKSKSPAPNYRAKTIDSASMLDDESPDHGTFTSITACGVLNKCAQPEAVTERRESRGAQRKNSLTKLQIDSSEYIQPKFDEKLLNSYTDYEKAKHCEYQLNIFSTIVPSYGATNTDEDNQSVAATEDEELSIKTAPTKNDWIQEWAKNARRRNTAMAAAATNGSPQLSHAQKSNGLRTKDQRMTQSYDCAYYHHPNDYDSNEFGDDVHNGNAAVDDSVAHFSRSSIRNSQRTNVTNGYETKRQSTSVLRPPISPTKIPSPVHTQLRGRSSSANRSFRNSNVDLDNLETEMYLEKTAAAISSLQKIHRKNNSPQSPSSPMRSTAPTEFGSSRNTYDRAVDLRPMHLHKRNLSLDVTHAARQLQDYSAQYDADGAFDAQIQERMRTRHTRHNSYENQMIQLHSPKRTSIDQTMVLAQQQPKVMYAEQQSLLNKYLDDEHARRRSSVGGGGGGGGEAATGSPIRRSSSFCHKNQAVASRSVAKQKPMVAARRVPSSSTSSGKALQKSASSSSFKKIMSTPGNNQHQLNNSEHEAKFYVNDDDDLQPADDVEYNLIYSSDESDMDATNSSNPYESDVAVEPPISHTRYNKAFLMRMEQNKQLPTAGIIGGVAGKGLQACPNTPEMQRRAVNPRASFRDRTSMPRDSSLSRMKQDIPNLQTTKRVLTQTASKDSNSSSIGSANKQRVLPKYMDISKYKPVQGQNFLKRDESKSTLINRSEIRKSPSAIGLSKADTTRLSGRVKSAGAKPNTPVNAKGIVVHSFWSLPLDFVDSFLLFHTTFVRLETRAREAELAMWRRRATYDPMKAAAEGRKKQEEAKKISQKASKYGDRYVHSYIVCPSMHFHLSNISKLHAYTHVTITFRTKSVKHRKNSTNQPITLFFFFPIILFLEETINTNECERNFPHNKLNQTICQKRIYNIYHFLHSFHTTYTLNIIYS